MHGKGCAPQVRKKERRDVLLASLLLHYSALYGMMFLGFRRDTFYVFIPKPTESSHIRFIAPFLVVCKNCLNWILRFLKRCGHDGFRVDRTHSWYLKWNEMMNVIDVLLPVMLSRPKLLSSWWRLLEQILITIGAHTGWWGQFSRLLLARHPLRTTKQDKGKNRSKQFLQYCSWP